MTGNKNLTDAEREKGMAELRDLVKRAKAGDRSAVPQLREYLTLNPQLWHNPGAIALHVQGAWINLTASSDLHLRECLVMETNRLKHELCGDSPTRLEALLVERVVTCWLQLGYLEAREAQAPERSEKWFQLKMQRQAMAEKQFRGAVNAMVTLRQLAPKLKDDDAKMVAPAAPKASAEPETVPEEVPPRLNGRINGNRVIHLLDPQHAGAVE